MTTFESLGLEVKCHDDLGCRGAGLSGRKRTLR